MIKTKHITTAFAALSAAIGVSLTAQAQEVGLWQFNGNLNSDNGGDPITTLFATGEFGTTESFAIGAINGESAQVMKFPAITEEDTGFVVPVPADLSNSNDYSYMVDVYYPAASNGTGRGLGDTSPDFAGAELGIGGNNAVVAGGASGVIIADTWHRVIITVDGTNGVITRYVDGVLTGTSGIAAADLPFGRYTLDSQLDIIAFGFTSEGFVNSLQLRGEVISRGHAAALGGASAAGLPAVLPEVSPFVEGWTPGGNIADRNTDIGVVINQGDATIDQGSIEFLLDGEAQNADVSKTGDTFDISVDRSLPFAPATKHTLTLNFTDDKEGAQSFTHEFDAAIYFEDFESAVLEPNVNEGLESDQAWTRTGMPGWEVDDSGVPGVGDDATDGVTEWAGWSFANKDWWTEAAGDQRRSEFSLASGNVLVADPDEWDDQGHDDSAENGWYETYVTSPPISLEGIAENTAFLQFASSWRDEFDSNYRQSVNIEVSFDGGAWQEIHRWLSDPASPDFHDDAPNETIARDLNNPAGAKEVVLKFGMFDAGNDWWWALDNIVVNAGVKPPVIASHPQGLEIQDGGEVTFSVAVDGTGPFTYEWFFNGDSVLSESSNETTHTFTLTKVNADSAGNYHVVISNAGGSTPPSDAAALAVKADLGPILFFEGFEDLVLGPNVDEGVPGDAVWTDTLPDGWSRENDLPGLDDEEVGVREWEGWNFADRAWWANTAGDQRRTEFVRGTGTIAIADGDEWDDKGSPAGLGLMNTLLTTPDIDISGIVPGTLKLRFNSSWRPEVLQTGLVEASYDGGDKVEVLRFSSDNASEDYKGHFPNDTVTVDLSDAPEGAGTLSLTFSYLEAGNNWWWAIDNIEVAAELPEAPPLASQDFEGLTLGSSVDEEVAADNVWTKTAPEGWTIDDSGVPGVGDPAQDGVTEWAGWSFASKDWWVETTGDQRRSEFTLGTGTVAIADGDEWDDQDHAEGFLDTFMSWTVDVSSAEARTLELHFDSSWRPEYDSNYHQTANVTVSFDGGEPIEVMLWESNAESPNYKPDSTNESVMVPLGNPGGVSSMVVTFGYFDAGNDWWWAIDNIKIKAGAAQPLPLPDGVYGREDFEGLALGSSVDEEVPADNVWTKETPPGFSIDDTGVPGVGDPAQDGVTEWAGWSFASKDWWVETTGDQRRSEFVNGLGTVAIADGDEWDDQDHAEGFLDTFLIWTMDISKAAANGLELQFDSSWRPEFDSNYHQTANVTASYDGGEPVQVMLWESDTNSPNYKPDTTNETVVLPLANPEGASQLVLSFGYFDAGNDWWWAIDNLEVRDAAAGTVIGISADAGQVTLTWEGGGTLEKASSLGGDWTAVEGATSPHTVAADESEAYFRVR